MGEVTNVILSFSNMEDQVSKRYEIELFSNNGRGFRLTSADFQGEENIFTVKNPRRWYAGGKFLQTPLFIGAYDHLDLDGLIDHLRSITWEEPENVQLIVQQEADSKFRIIEPV